MFFFLLKEKNLNRTSDKHHLTNSINTVPVTAASSEIMPHRLCLSDYWKQPQCKTVHWTTEGIFHSTLHCWSQTEISHYLDSIRPEKTKPKSVCNHVGKCNYSSENLGILLREPFTMFCCHLYVLIWSHCCTLFIFLYWDITTPLPPPQHFVFCFILSSFHWGW